MSKPFDARLPASRLGTAGHSRFNARAAFFLTVALLGTLAHTTDAWASIAPVCRGVDIQIEILPFEVIEDFTTPFAQLEGEGREVGLVRETTTVNVEGCKATVGYANPRLYVARELNANACAFETVLEHEQRHVDIYRHALLDLAQRIRTAAVSRPLFEAAVDEVTAVRAAQERFDASEWAAGRNELACGGRIYRLALHRERRG